MKTLLDILSSGKNDITIATHGDTHHADDVLAEVIFRRACKKLGIAPEDTTRLDRESIRNGDWEAYDVCFDIGRKYGYCEDTDTYILDHHQKGWKEGRLLGNTFIPYAAAGLMWKELGMLICNDDIQVFRRIDKVLVAPIDASDNGHKIWEANNPDVFPQTLQSIVSLFTGCWDEAADCDKQFEEAVALMDVVFERTLKKIASKFAAKTACVSALEAQVNGVAVLDRFMPWHEYFVGSKVLVVVFKQKDRDWRAVAVPKKIGDFETHISFPKTWRGLDQAELRKVTSVKDAIFCHNAGFMATAESCASAMQLAKAAIDAALMVG